MKSPQHYRTERHQAAQILKDFNDRACGHFAEVLRKHDEYVRSCAELGIPAPELIPVAYFEAVYKLLSFGPLPDRATLMLGHPDEIETLVSRVQTAKGFYADTGHWIEL